MHPLVFLTITLSLLCVLGADILLDVEARSTSTTKTVSTTNTNTKAVKNLIDEKKAAAFLAADEKTEETCMISTSAWGIEMREYAMWHAAALSELRLAAAAAGGPRNKTGDAVVLPRLSIYRFNPATSWIGFGDAVAGISNVFLSAVRRRRVFLLDWPEQEVIIAPILSHLETMGVDWHALAKAYGPNRSYASWFVIEGVPTMKPKGSFGPILWPQDGATWGSGADVEVSEHYNRGALTQEGGGGRAAVDTAWLFSVLPMGTDGKPLYGCVYRASFSISKSVLRMASQHVPLPSTNLVCAHIRSWSFSDAEISETTNALLDCLEKSADNRGALSIFLASDSQSVRTAARARLTSGGFQYFEAPDKPQHIGYKANIKAVDREAALAVAMQDWWLLSTCSVVVTSPNTGFSRTALAMGGGQPIISAPDDNDEEFLCVMTERDWGKGDGSGW